MAIDYEKYRETMNRLEYPPNHKYDPETFEPIGVTIECINAINRFAPELLSKHESLLDVGCNKGFMSFYLRGYYNKIVAIDPLTEWIEFAEDLRKINTMPNIEFRVQRFEDTPEVKYSVIHFGQCSHYLYRDEIRRCDDPLTFVRKAKRMAQAAIVIDGAFGLDDPSPRFDSVKNNWNDDVKRMCTLEHYIKVMQPEFKFVRFNPSGGCDTRHIAVWKKV